MRLFSLFAKFTVSIIERRNENVNFTYISYSIFINFRDCGSSDRRRRCRIHDRVRRFDSSYSDNMVDNKIHPPKEEIEGSKMGLLLFSREIHTPL